jgi:putative PIN family toxin of toxin-antitoxin system
LTDTIKPVVVLDTGCILQAVINPAGPAGAVINLLDQDRITVYVSPRLRSEYEDTLARPAIRAKNPAVSDAQVQAGLARLDQLAIMVPPPPRYVTYPRDPNDEPVINLAIHVNADFIVTRDKDLLTLMDESEQDGMFFRRQFPDLSILSPTAFIDAVNDR